MIKTNVCKKCRRYKTKLFLKGERCLLPKCSFTRRDYAPGMHGQKKTRRISDYGWQLHEKQKAKIIYGLGEKQLRQLITSGDIAGKLETRLDNIVYVSGLASSRRQARQMIVHGKILVNGRKVSSPSFHIRKNHTIKTVSKIAKTSQTETPKWLKLDKTKSEVKVIANPELDSSPTNINPELIIEYFRR